MGEKAKEVLKLQFDKRLRLEFHGARITSDAGLSACQELDEVLELAETAPINMGVDVCPQRCSNFDNL